MAGPSQANLRKDISLLGVFTLSLGTTISSGFFLLPGIAFSKVGPAILLSYLLAGMVFIPPLLCKSELATAMPKAGGAYFYLDRAFGPMIGAVAGLSTWISLTLKTSFALVGSGFYIGLFLDDPPILLIAIGFAIFFGIVNTVGVGKTTKMQAFLVLAVIGMLAWFIVQGGVNVNTSHFDDFLGESGFTIVSMTGVVLVSYMGLTKVASVAEEVRDPERNIPLGIILALICAILIYLCGIAVMIGTVPAEELATTYTPAALAAEAFAGRGGMIVISIAALASFLSVANAGILSASRYPMAMSRDHMIPSIFRRLGRFGTPVPAIALTVSLIIVQILVLDPLVIAKYAGTMKLLLFTMLSIALIVMRESKLDSYDPGYKVPFYPWLPMIGILGCLLAMIFLGWVPIVFAASLVVVGIIWFRAYAAPRVRREGAIYHLFSRLGRPDYDPLDIELRGIIKEKGLRPTDPFDEIIARSHVLECQPDDSFSSIASKAARVLSEETGHAEEEFQKMFLEGTRVGATPVMGGVALPHLRMDGLNRPHLVLVRCREHLDVEVGYGTAESMHMAHVHALFFMASPDSDPTQHLRLLASLASAVEQDGFMNRWLEADTPAGLKAALLRNDRSITLAIEDRGPCRAWIGKPLSQIEFPEEVLVAQIYHQGERHVPTGKTVLAAGDHVIVIGEAAGIAALREQLELDAS
ncbi:MAG: amino acid permease [Phycisphaerales bacterium]|nr:amino acid permease [Phycisphaerales bacterium]